MTEILEGQVSIFDLDSQYGRTYPEPLVATEGMISEQYCKRSAMSAKKEELQYLNLKADGGNLLGASWETVGALPGESMTLSTGEFPKEEKESTLLQILDRNVPDKYCLSKKACLGILKRSPKRKKTLPDILIEALTEVVGNG